MFETQPGYEDLGRTNEVNGNQSQANGEVANGLENEEQVNEDNPPPGRGDNTVRKETALARNSGKKDKRHRYRQQDDDKILDFMFTE